MRVYRVSGAGRGDKPLFSSWKVSATVAAILRRIGGSLRKHPPVGDAPYLIVGLGNPGNKYAENRHNIGFRLVDRVAGTSGVRVARKKRFHAEVGEGRIGAHRVVLAKPLTFMNDSGRAVQAIRHWYKVPTQHILVIYDDLDLPLGRIRLRQGGSSGGHNGMRSTITALGSDGFARLRVGIGRPTRGDPIDYVLSDFTRDEEPVVGRLCDRVDEIVLRYLDDGIKAAMNEYNGWAIE